MHFSLQATLTTAALAGLVAAGELDISFDKALEGQTGTVQIVDTVPGRLSILASSLGKDATEEGGPQMKAHVRSLLTPRGALEALSGKRALSCEPGYGYCSQLGGCCPTSDRCCSYGYCLRPGGVCCPSGPCGPGKECCGKSHCMTAGSTCCRDELYCPKGNSCYIVDGVRDSVCCTNSRCTAHVGENGLTTTAPVYTTTRTVTTTRTQYYYWTITWYYYYYYWTYVASSVVTSSRTSTSSVFSVYTTNSQAALSYFSSLSRTLSLPTPASATSLASLAPQTGGQTIQNVPDSTAGNGDDGGSSSSAGPRASSAPPGNQSGGPNSASAARSLWSTFDSGFLTFLAFGGTIGVVAVML